MNDEELLGCGNAAEGQLGFGGIEDNVTELTKLTLTNEFCDCREIACGRSHSIFLLASGALYACGNNDYCQLGYEGPRKKPRLVEGFAGLSVVQAACGDNYSVCLTEDGHVHSWGCNDSGELGGVISEAAKAKSLVLFCEVNLTKIVQIACGSKHSLALEASGIAVCPLRISSAAPGVSDGVVYSWGSNSFGQLGLGHNRSQDSPQPLTKLHGIPFMQVAAGSYHSFVNSTSGSIYGWGKNSCGQLGVGDTMDRQVPVLNKSLKNQKIIRIVCGEDFSAAVSIDGHLFTFGSGTYGQLGHGTKNNEVLPKQVMEMMGSKVSDVACGRCHTIVLASDKVYTFGLNTSGQLGAPGCKPYCLVPQVVTSCKPWSKVFAGGEYSFLLSPSEAAMAQWPEISRSIVALSLDDLRAVAEQREVDTSVSRITTAVSSLNCLNGSFLKVGAAKFGTSSKNSGLDLDTTMEGFKLLYDCCAASSQLEQMVIKSLELSIIPSLSASPPGVEALRVYLLLPWCHVFLSPENYRNVVVPFACCFSSLTSTAWKIIESWWQDAAERHLNRVLKVFKQVVVNFVNAQVAGAESTNAETAFRQSAIKYALDVLSHLHVVNKKVRKIPVSNFYVDELQTKVDVRSDYIAWLFRKSDSQFSFCNYPFVFNAVVKATLLEVDIGVQMQLQVEATAMSSFNSLFTLTPMHVSPYLILTVSRANIVDDTLVQLLGLSAGDLKRPLKVQFIGEDADDVGGVKKEFFMLLFQELLHPKYGMFAEYTETKRIWFSSVTFEDHRTYEFVGILCGLAIYNGVIVALPFPLALYRKLLNEPVSLEDLKELSPTEGRSLEQLLDYDGDDIADVFAITFTVSVTMFGETRQIELKPGGAEIPVTKQNRQEFVDLYVEYKLNKSIDAGFVPFATGFRRVVTSQLIQFFQPEELMELVVGNEHYDWFEFERCTGYRGEYWHDHPTIKLFWEVFHSLTPEQKKKFLLFLTGSDRIPFLGMKQVKMTIQPSGGGPQYYPVAHTCFNLLDLPKFTDKETLARKLKEAIEHNQGFTLI